MRINKEKANLLFDFYENLFTEKQKDVLNQYYRLDYSLSEISFNLKVTKSAVSDILNRCNKQLIDYEDKLQLVKKHQKRLDIINKYSNDTDKLISKLKEID